MPPPKVKDTKPKGGKTGRATKAKEGDSPKVVSEVRAEWHTGYGNEEQSSRHLYDSVLRQQIVDEEIALTQTIKQEPAGDLQSKHCPV